MYFYFAIYNSIADSIQDMSFSYQFIKPSVKYGYEIEKIYTFLGKGHPLGEKFFHSLISVGFLPKQLLSIENKNILRLVFDSYIYNENIESCQPVDITAFKKPE